MANNLGTRGFVNGLRDLLADEARPVIDAALTEFGPRARLKKVYGYEKMVVDGGMYPCLMLGNPSKSKKWVSTEFGIEERFELDIVGYTLHDDSEDNANMILAFGDALEAFFEARHMFHFQLPNWLYTIHWGDSEVPIGQLTYELEAVGTGSNTLLLRSFTAKGVFFVDRTLGYPSGITPS